VTHTESWRTVVLAAVAAAAVLVWQLLVDLRTTDQGRDWKGDALAWVSLGLLLSPLLISVATRDAHIDRGRLTRTLRVVGLAFAVASVEVWFLASEQILGPGGRHLLSIMSTVEAAIVAAVASLSLLVTTKVG